MKIFIRSRFMEYRSSALVKHIGVLFLQRVLKIQAGYIFTKAEDIVFLEVIHVY